MTKLHTLKQAIKVHNHKIATVVSKMGGISSSIISTKNPLI